MAFAEITEPKHATRNPTDQERTRIDTACGGGQGPLAKRGFDPVQEHSRQEIARSPNGLGPANVQSPAYDKRTYSADFFSK